MVQEEEQNFLHEESGALICILAAAPSVPAKNWDQKLQQFLHILVL